MGDEIFTPHAFFFDTSVLLAAGWPNPSAQLLQQLDQMDGLNMLPCLPDVVRTELVEHTIRKMKEDWDHARTHFAKIVKKLSSIPRLSPLPQDKLIRDELGR